MHHTGLSVASQKEWPQGGASGMQGSENCTRLAEWATHIFPFTGGEPARHC